MECEGIDFDGTAGGRVRYQIEIRNAPVGSFLTMYEYRTTRACLVDHFSPVCFEGFPCIRCEDWSGTPLDWFSQGNGCPLSPTRRESDPANTRCMVETIGERVDPEGGMFTSVAGLATYSSSFGAGRLPVVYGPELLIACPARRGQVIESDTSAPLPPPLRTVTLPTPDTTSDFQLLEARCAPHVLERPPLSGEFEGYQRAEIVARVRAPVGGRAELTATFPFYIGFGGSGAQDPECVGNSRCTYCFEWGGGDVRRAGDPEESTCVSYEFIGLSRFPFAASVRGTIFSGHRSIASATLGTIQCEASVADVQTLDAECDYVQVGARVYQRHRIAARVSGEDRSSLHVWFRERDDDGTFSYTYPGCRLDSSNPPCTPPEDCLVCDGWTGASAQCPSGNAVYRTPGDPLSAVCTHTRYLASWLSVGDHHVVLEHTTAENAAFGETIRMYCPPPPAVASTAVLFTHPDDPALVAFELSDGRTVRHIGRRDATGIPRAIDRIEVQRGPVSSAEDVLLRLDAAGRLIAAGSRDRHVLLELSWLSATEAQATRTVDGSARTTIVRLTNPPRGTNAAAQMLAERGDAIEDRAHLGLAPAAAADAGMVGSLEGTVHVSVPCGVDSALELSGTYELPDGRTQFLPLEKAAQPFTWAYRILPPKDPIEADAALEAIDDIVATCDAELWAELVQQGCGDACDSLKDAIREACPDIGELDEVSDIHIEDRGIDSDIEVAIQAVYASNGETYWAASPTVRIPAGSKGPEIPIKFSQGPAPALAVRSQLVGGSVQEPCATQQYGIEFALDPDSCPELGDFHVDCQAKQVRGDGLMRSAERFAADGSGRCFGGAPVPIAPGQSWGLGVSVTDGRGQPLVVATGGLESRIDPISCSPTPTTGTPPPPPTPTPRPTRLPVTPTPIPTVVVPCGSGCSPDATSCLCNCACPAGFCVTQVRQCQIVCAPVGSPLGCLAGGASAALQSFSPAGSPRSGLSAGAQ